MFYIRKARGILYSIRRRSGTLILILAILAGCSGTGDDLLPSGEDQRPTIVDGAIGGRPGNTAPDFALITTVNSNFTLSDYPRGGANEAEAVVLYFTMWCPICSAHMDQIQFEIMPKFAGADVIYLAVDYLSDSVIITRQSQLEAGFSDGDWLAAPDPGQVVTSIFQGTMGTTVVIDPDGIVRLNEDFRTGENLVRILTELTAPTP
jgi:peroxiredoxin